MIISHIGPLRGLFRGPQGCLIGLKQRQKALHDPKWPHITANVQARYALAKQIKGTLGFHQFEPVPNSTTIIVKAVSSDVQGFEKQTSK